MLLVELLLTAVVSSVIVGALCRPVGVGVGGPECPVLLESAMVSTQPPRGGSRQAERGLRCGRGVEWTRLWRRGKGNGELVQTQAAGPGGVIEGGRRVNIKICWSSIRKCRQGWREVDGETPLRRVETAQIQHMAQVKKALAEY